MTRSHITVAIRLLGLYIFADVVTKLSLMLIFSEQQKEKAWLFFIFAIAIMFLIPILLWLIAPILSRLALKSDSDLIDNSKYSTQNLFALGTFLIGVSIFPDAFVSMLKNIYFLLYPPLGLPSDTMWKYSPSILQASLISSLATLAISLIFVFCPMQTSSICKSKINGG